MNTKPDEYEYWNRKAKAYDRKNDYVVGTSTQALIRQWLESRIRSMDEVLELGCGTGLFSQVIAARAQRLVATDLSEEMLRLAEKRLTGMPHAVAQKEDCYHLSFPDAAFDCVFLGNLVHIVAEPDRILQEARRVLKNDGRVILIDATNSGLPFRSKLKMSIRYLSAFGLPPKSNKSLKPKAVEKMVFDAGFSIAESKFLGKETRAICLVGQK